MLKAIFLTLSLSFDLLAVEPIMLGDIYVSEQGDIERSLDHNSSAVERVDSARLEELQVSSLDDLLKTVPGVVTVGGPRSSAESPQIRGLKSSKIVIYIDGVKQNFRTSHNGMVLTDPEDLKAVDIYKSSATVGRGGGGLGGGIFFTTKDPCDYLFKGQKWGALIRLGYEDAGAQKKLVTRVYGQSNFMNYLLSYNHTTSNDLYLSDKNKLENSAFEDQSFSLKGVRKRGKGQYLKVGASYYKRSDRIPLNPTLEVPGSEKSLTGDNTLKKTTLFLQFNYLKGSTKQLNLFSDLYYNEHLLKQKRVSDGRVDIRRVRTYGGALFNNFYLKKRADRDNVLTLGSEFLFDQGFGSRAEGPLASFPSGQGHLIGTYLQYSGKLGDKFFFSPSLRYDYYSLKSDNSTLPKHAHGNLAKKLALRYLPLYWFTLYANYAEGFNAPRLQDIYIDGLHHLGIPFLGIPDNYFIPNPNLRYETSKSYEGGVEIELGELLSKEDYLKFKVAIFRNNYKDYISFLKDDFLGRTELINIPRAKMWGQELSLEYFYKVVEFSLGFTRTRGWNTTDNQYLEEMPADQLSSGVKFIFEEYGLKIGYRMQQYYSQGRVNYGSTSVTDSTQSYLLHSAFLTQEFSNGMVKGLSYSLRIENLANTKYRKHATSIMELGRNFKASCSYKF